MSDEPCKEILVIGNEIKAMREDIRKLYESVEKINERLGELEKNQVWCSKNFNGYAKVEQVNEIMNELRMIKVMMDSEKRVFGRYTIIFGLVLTVLGILSYLHII